MDAFFVSVSLRNKPELLNKPVVVAHSSKQGEIASCNYAARSFGIKNGERNSRCDFFLTLGSTGMQMVRARGLCPDLISVPYEFEKYKEVSRRFYSIMGESTTKIQAVSCDEVLCV